MVGVVRVVWKDLNADGDVILGHAVRVARGGGGVEVWDGPRDRLRDRGGQARSLERGEGWVAETEGVGEEGCRLVGDRGCVSRCPP